MNGRALLGIYHRVLPRTMGGLAGRRYRDGTVLLAPEVFDDIDGESPFGRLNAVDWEKLRRDLPSALATWLSQSR